MAEISKYIVDEDMGPGKKSKYVDSIWEDTGDNMLRLFFGRKIYFLKQLDIEILKITDSTVFDDEDNAVYGKRKFEDMTLFDIRKINPDFEEEPQDKAFEKLRKGCPCGSGNRNHRGNWFLSLYHA